MMSRQKVSVKAGSGFGFGKANSFQLPRFGILGGLVLKLCVNQDTTDGAAPGENCGNALLKRAALTSHSREIEQTLDIMNLTHVLEMQLGAKTCLMNLALNDDPVSASLIQGDNFIYVPLNFSFCRSGLSMSLDLSFCESIECVVELDEKANVFGATNLANLAVDAAQTELLVYYYNLQESDLRKYEDAEFSIERPLSMMAKSCYRENAVSKTIAQAKTETVTVNFNCPNVITKTAIGVYELGSGLKGSYRPVDKIEYFMSGRLVWSSTGVEESQLENSLFYGTSYGAGEVSGTVSSTDNSQNIYTHFWGISNEHNRMSGACSGKNISDFSVQVTFTTPSSGGDKKYYVEAQHETVNIVSISGSSGKIGVSLSL